MEAFKGMVNAASNNMVFIAGIILCFIMGVSVTDVIMRNIGKPIIGGYELVSLAGGLMAGFALPHSFLKKAHVKVDIIVEKLHPLAQTVLEKITIVLGLLFMLLVIWYLSKLSFHLAKTETVSQTMGIPTYFVSFGIVAGCIIQCLILIYGIFSKKEANPNE